MAKLAALELRLMSVKPVALPYLAGLIDGEGSITISVHKGGRRTKVEGSGEIRVCNTHAGVIEWIQENFGGGISLSKRGPRRLDLFTWILSGQAAARLLEACLPFMIIKKDRANSFIAYHKLLRSQGARLTDEEIQERVNFIHSLPQSTKSPTKYAENN